MCPDNETRPAAPPFGAAPTLAWLQELNPEQRRAASHGDGPLLIVAGAGTGKTRTLAYRVAYLMARGVDPERILLLTFTRRAAEEMLKRAAAIVPRGPAVSGRIWGGTFHAIANRILRKLDPPSSTSDLAGPPAKDEDWLVLSTIHSAKGCEWDAVYLIHAADGASPAKGRRDIAAKIRSMWE